MKRWVVGAGVIALALLAVWLLGPDPPPSPSTVPDPPIASSQESGEAPPSIAVTPPPESDQSPAPEAPGGDEPGSSILSIQSTAEGQAAPSQSRITGRVVTEDGLPVAEATVHVTSGFTGLRNILAVAQSDFEGEFEILNPHALLPEGADLSFTLSAQAPGFATGNEPVALRPPALEESVTIVMTEGHALSGRVIWSDTGEAVADAELVFSLGGYLGTVRADGLGGFRATGLPVGNVWIAVAPPGRVHQSGGRQEVPGESATVELTRPDGVVTGRVVGLVSDEPKPNVEVWLGDDIIGPNAWTAVTDDEGRFEFAEIPREGWTARLAEHPSTTAWGSLSESDRADLTLLYPEPVRIAGKVQERESGEPVGSLHLVLNIEGNELETVTDSDGAFDLGALDLVPGERLTDLEWTVGIRTDSPWVALDPRQEISSSDLAHLAILADPGLPLQVTVLDPDGNPLPGVRVAVRPMLQGRPFPLSQDFLMGPITDSDGRSWAVRRDMQSLHRVLASSRTYPIGYSEPVSPEQSETTVQMLPLHPLRFVVTVDGEPARNAGVRLERDFGGPGELHNQDFMHLWWGESWGFWNRQTDARGVVEYDNVSRYHYSADIWANQGEESLSRRFALDLRADGASEEIHINFRTGEMVEVVGRVVNVDGVGIPGANVRWYGTQSSQGDLDSYVLGATTDATGNFTFVMPDSQRRFGLAALAEGFLPTLHWPNQPQDWQSEEGTWILPLPAVNRLHGRVVDIHGGPATGVVLIPWVPTPQLTSWERMRPRFPAHEYPISLGDGQFDFALDGEQVHPSYSGSPSEFPVSLLAMDNRGNVAFIVTQVDMSHGRSVDVGALQLRPGNIVEGLVVDGDGLPRSGVEIHWQSEGTQDHSNLPERRQWRTMSDPDGRFTLHPIPDGHWRLSLRLDEEGAVEEFDVPSDEPLVLEFDL